MTEKNCIHLFEDFISSCGPNLLLCEFEFDSKKEKPLTCYSSNLKTYCHDNVNISNYYSTYLQKIKIEEMKIPKYVIIPNFINETKLFTISVVKKY
jgi:hypothetical protein